MSSVEFGCGKSRLQEQTMDHSVCIEKWRTDKTGEDMLTEQLRQSLAEYISTNYVEPQPQSIDDSIYGDIFKDSGKNYSNKESFTLDQLMEELGESFHDMLFLKIDMSGKTDVEVYKRAGIDRKLFSKIRSNPAYHPSKQTVLALAIALELPLNDTVDLLARAEYALSPGSKGDLIVKYFIERGIYDIDVINFALDEYDQPALG